MLNMVPMQNIPRVEILEDVEHALSDLVVQKLRDKGLEVGDVLEQQAMTRFTLGL